MPTITGELLTGSCTEVSGGRRIRVANTNAAAAEARRVGCQEAHLDFESNYIDMCCPPGVTASSGERGVVATVVDALQSGWNSLAAKVEDVGQSGWGTTADPITQAVDQGINKQLQEAPGAQQEQEQAPAEQQQQPTMSPATKILIIGGVSTLVLGGLYLFYRSMRS